MSETVIVKVGMADLNVAGGGQSLRTTGLGSCVGLTLFDPVVRVAGMAHVMLPSSSISKDAALNKAKYADTALPELLLRMQKVGAIAARLQAKLAGGAQMFTFSSPAADTMRIGPRNVEACKEALWRYNIPIIAEDTGGNYGRTIEIESATGKLFVRSVQLGAKEL
ncbi:chemotaxis protein CheD [Paenibacillus antri]|uniref:Probable chemoreceptor glutamine deamidase CheD n=1 Tax=Paenibacillus antri TaxID=2582848 RepID=A0A5R9G660_9BACL|nr:chemotaxis protein CheD [Paenibacillus antri]TLS49826.1 chemotaxis protein CheD [Paenibacillus antri]